MAVSTCKPYCKATARRQNLRKSNGRSLFLDAACNIVFEKLSDEIQSRYANINLEEVLLHRLARYAHRSSESSDRDESVGQNLWSYGHDQPPPDLAQGRSNFRPFVVFQLTVPWQLL